MEIYVAKAGRETGPFGPDQIQPMVDSGMLALTDSLWHQDLAGWVPVYQYLNIRPPLPQDAPVQMPVIGPVHRSGELAAFGRRAGAALIDGLVWFVATSFVWGVLLDLLFGEGLAYTSYRETDRIFWISGGVLGWIYSASMESSSCKATLGKLAFGLVVTTRDGRRIDFWKATKRYSGKWIVPVTLGIGFLPCAWTEWKQALHDMIAGTIVVRK